MRLLLSLCFAVFISPLYAQQSSLSLISYPPEGDVLRADSNTIYFIPGDSFFDQWRMTLGSSQGQADLYDSGATSFTGWEGVIGGADNNGQPVYLRFYQRANGGTWSFFDTQYIGAASGGGGSLGSVSAASDPVNISWPVPGATITESDSTIYFGPGASPVDEYRITVGSSANSIDLYDSGTRDFFDEGWEHRVLNVASYPGTVYLAIWQRAYNGSWAASTYVYNTSNGASNRTGTTVTNNNTTTNVGNTNQPPPPVLNGETVTQLSAVHRSGQTFLTWREVNNSTGYHVYRHTSPITENNLNSAERLTSRWGALDTETSRNRYAREGVPQNYVITNSGSPLSDQTGLFVHTSQNNGSYYYAVTSIINGREVVAMSSGNNSLSGSVSETINTPAPVLAYSVNNGRGRVYTHYMDYANWNPTLSGYAYNYAVALPAGYDPSRSYPLMVELHAYSTDYRVVSESEYGWQVIQLLPSDPGSNGSIHSWWYGYSADNNYNVNRIPNSGIITNFTEQRLMKAIDEVVANSEFNVDQNRIHLWGHSMGASGALAVGSRYGNRIAGIYASQPMTNYKTSTLFQDEFEQLWGYQTSNLPVRNSGPYSGAIQRYDGTAAWDWMNHQQQLLQRGGDDMSYLMVDHGKADTVIDWATQGEPMARALNQSKVGFSSFTVAGAGHNWMGFGSVVGSLFGLPNDAWRYPLSLSFPAISNASGSGSLFPNRGNDDQYNLNIEWATPHTAFAPSIVDQSRLYQITLRSLANNQSADITPRNTQSFSPNPGDFCQWVATDNNSGSTINSGGLSVDSSGLATATGVPIRTGTGTLLSIDCR